MNWQFSNDAPIYAQLIGQIRAGIVSGAFSPQLDKCGLTTAVGTKKAHDPARLNGKADAIQRRNLAVALGELVTF